ncbi:hypothetical protein ScPMuIL_007898 [Solemya velum]
MEGYACNHDNPYQLTVQDRYKIFAKPRQSISSGRNSCNIKFLTHETGRINIDIREVKIEDCGTTIKIYDGDEYMKNVRWQLTCNSKAGQVFTTSTNYLIIRLEKQSADSSNAYRFELSVSVDQAGGIVPEDDNMSSSTLSAGALAGIGVGIAAVVVVFVALIIWCCIRYMRQGEEKRAQSVQSVYSTPSSKSHTTAGSKPVEVFIGVENKEPYAARNGKGYDNMAYRHSSQSSDEGDGPVSNNPRGRSRSSDRRSRDHVENKRNIDNTRRQRNVEFREEPVKTKKEESNVIVKQSASKQYSSAKERSEKQTSNAKIRSDVIRDPRQDKNKMRYHDNPAFENESERRSRSPTRSSESYTRSYSPSQDTSKQSESVDSSENGVGCHFRRNNQRSSTRSRSSSRARSNRRQHGGSLTRSSSGRSRSHGHHRHRSSRRSRSRSRSRSPAVKYHDRQSYADEYYTSRATNI